MRILFVKFWSIHLFSEEINDEELIKKIFEVCLVDNTTAPVSEKQKLLTQLATAIKNGHTESVIQNFK